MSSLSECNRMTYLWVSGDAADRVGIPDGMDILRAVTEQMGKSFQWFALNDSCFN